MKNLVRGGALLTVLVLLAAIMYAQTKPETDALIIANDSQTKIDNNISDIQTVINQVSNQNKESVNKDQLVKKQVSVQKVDNTQTDQADNKKLVKTTAMVSAAGRGASRGSFSATAYCLQGKTAMGHRVRRGIIAADPRVLKLGSTVTIGSGPYAGSYLVSDTGGRIKGKKIDIWMPNCSEARRFGRRNVQIFSN